MSRSKLFIFYLCSLMGECLVFVAPVLSAGLVLTAVYSLNALGISYWVLLALSPVFYGIWMVVYFALSGLETTILGWVFEKPRRLDPMQDFRSAIQTLIMLFLGRKFAFICTLPAIYNFTIPPFFPWLTKLVMRSYSTTTHLGRGARTFTWLSDPELTHVGDNVVIGYGVAIDAHTMNTLPDGRVVYQSEPILIEPNVTIGGHSHIWMGAKIQRGAVIEMAANVLPYTRIGPDEVWGGNPAVFLRMSHSQPAHSRVRVEKRTEHVKRAELVSIIADAIHIPPEEVGSKLSSAGNTGWDSIDLMAIAAALYDSFGLSLNIQDLSKVDSAFSLERLIESHLQVEYSQVQK